MIGLKPARIQHLKKHIMVFFFIFGKEGQKKSKTLTISCLMLKAICDNSKTTFASSFIKLSKVVESISSLKFRFMDMAKFNASLNNQSPLE